jgi:hypothetical protein
MQLINKIISLPNKISKSVVSFFEDQITSVLQKRKEQALSLADKLNKLDSLKTISGDSYHLTKRDIASLKKELKINKNNLIKLLKFYSKHSSSSESKYFSQYLINLINDDYIKLSTAINNKTNPKDLIDIFSLNINTLSEEIQYFLNYFAFAELKNIDSELYKKMAPFLKQNKNDNKGNKELTPRNYKKLLSDKDFVAHIHETGKTIFSLKNHPLYKRALKNGWDCFMPKIEDSDSPVNNLQNYFDKLSAKKQKKWSLPKVLKLIVLPVALSISGLIYTANHMTKDIQSEKDESAKSINKEEQAIKALVSDLLAQSKLEKSKLEAYISNDNDNDNDNDTKDIATSEMRAELLNSIILSESEKNEISAVSAQLNEATMNSKKQYNSDNYKKEAKEQIKDGSPPQETGAINIGAPNMSLPMSQGTNHLFGSTSLSMYTTTYLGDLTGDGSASIINDNTIEEDKKVIGAWGKGYVTLNCSASIFHMPGSRFEIQIGTSIYTMPDPSSVTVDGKPYKGDVKLVRKGLSYFLSFSAPINGEMKVQLVADKTVANKLLEHKDQLLLVPDIKNPFFNSIIKYTKLLKTPEQKVKYLTKVFSELYVYSAGNQILNDTLEELGYFNYMSQYYAGDCDMLSNLMAYLLRRSDVPTVMLVGYLPSYGKLTTGDKHECLAYYDKTSETFKELETTTFTSKNPYKTERLDNVYSQTELERLNVAEMKFINTRVQIINANKEILIKSILARMLTKHTRTINQNTIDKKMESTFSHTLKLSSSEINTYLQDMYTRNQSKTSIMINDALIDFAALRFIMLNDNFNYKEHSELFFSNHTKLGGIIRTRGKKNKFEGEKLDSDNIIYHKFAPILFHRAFLDIAQSPHFRSYACEPTLNSSPYGYYLAYGNEGSRFAKIQVPITAKVEENLKTIVSDWEANYHITNLTKDKTINPDLFIKSTFQPIGENVFLFYRNNPLIIISPKDNVRYHPQIRDIDLTNEHSTKSYINRYNGKYYLTVRSGGSKLYLPDGTTYDPPKENLYFEHIKVIDSNTFELYYMDLSGNLHVKSNSQSMQSKLEKKLFEIKKAYNQFIEDKEESGSLSVSIVDNKTIFSIGDDYLYTENGFMKMSSADSYMTINKGNPSITTQLQQGHDYYTFPKNLNAYNSPFEYLLKSTDQGFAVFDKYNNKLGEIPFWSSIKTYREGPNLYFVNSLTQETIAFNEYLFDTKYVGRRNMDNYWPNSLSSDAMAYYSLSDIIINDIRGDIDKLNSISKVLVKGNTINNQDGFMILEVMRNIADLKNTDSLPQNINNFITKIHNDNSSYYNFLNQNHLKKWLVLVDEINYSQSGELSIQKNIQRYKPSLLAAYFPGVIKQLQDSGQLNDKLAETIIKKFVDIIQTGQIQFDSQEEKNAVAKFVLDYQKNLTPAQIKIIKIELAEIILSYLAHTNQSENLKTFLNSINTTNPTIIDAKDIIINNFSDNNKHHTTLDNNPIDFISTYITLEKDQEDQVKQAILISCINLFHDKFDSFPLPFKAELSGEQVSWPILKTIYTQDKRIPLVNMLSFQDIIGIADQDINKCRDTYQKISDITENENLNLPKSSMKQLDNKSIASTYLQFSANHLDWWYMILLLISTTTVITTSTKKRKMLDNQIKTLIGQAAANGAISSENIQLFQEIARANPASASDADIQRIIDNWKIPLSKKERFVLDLIRLMPKKSKDQFLSTTEKIKKILAIYPAIKTIFKGKPTYELSKQFAHELNELVMNPDTEISSLKDSLLSSFMDLGAQKIETSASDQTTDSLNISDVGIAGVENFIRHNKISFSRIKSEIKSKIRGNDVVSSGRNPSSINEDLREYADGDDASAINYVATARFGKTMVNTSQQFFKLTSVAVDLDTSSITKQELFNQFLTLIFGLKKEEVMLENLIIKQNGQSHTFQVPRNGKKQLLLWLQNIISDLKLTSTRTILDRANLYPDKSLHDKDTQIMKTILSFNNHENASSQGQDKINDLSSFIQNKGNTGTIILLSQNINNTTAPITMDPVINHPNLQVFNCSLNLDLISP